MFLFISSFSFKDLYNQTLRSFGIHGIGGIAGAVLTGIFVSPSISGTTTSLWLQIESVLITVAFSAIGSFIILKIIDKTVGLRVDHDDERQGLDLTLHGERIE